MNAGRLVAIATLALTVAAGAAPPRRALMVDTNGVIIAPTNLNPAASGLFPLDWGNTISNALALAGTGGVEAASNALAAAITATSNHFDTAAMKVADYTGTGAGVVNTAAVAQSVTAEGLESFGEGYMWIADWSATFDNGEFFVDNALNASNLLGTIDWNQVEDRPVWMESAPPSDTLTSNNFVGAGALGIVNTAAVAQALQGAGDLAFSNSVTLAKVTDAGTAAASNAAAFVWAGPGWTNGVRPISKIDGGTGYTGYAWADTNFWRRLWP